MALKLYEPQGWLNIPTLDSLNMNFNIIIGPRQCGKTYGTLKKLIVEKRKFIFMRRIPVELETALRGSTSVFQKLAQDLDFEFEITKESQFIRGLKFYRQGECFLECIALAMTSVSKVRGFSGYAFTDLVYDEFIPEISVKKIKGEGDAFINAYITLNGNRELEGKPALKCWMLANSNDLFSPILAEMQLIQKVESMVNKDQEYSIMADRGVVLVRPKATDIMDKRSKTALYRLTGTETAAAQMALSNKFVYNDVSDIGSAVLDEYNCVYQLGNAFVWADKSTNTKFYICEKYAGSPPNVNCSTTRGMISYLADMGYAHFVDAIYKGTVAFANYEVKRQVYSLFNKPLL